LSSLSREEGRSRIPPCARFSVSSYPHTFGTPSTRPISRFFNSIHFVHCLFEKGKKALDKTSGAGKTRDERLMSGALTYINIQSLKLDWNQNEKRLKQEKIEISLRGKITYRVLS
jgi:hypothetical protein